MAWDTWDNLVFLGESVFPRKVQQETTQRSGAPLQIPSIDEKTSSKAARDYALGASFATQETTFTSRAHVLMLLHGKFNQTTSLTYTVSSRFWKQHAIISKTVCYKQNCFCLYCTISLIKHHLHSSSRFTSLYTCSSSKKIKAQQVHKRSTRTTSYHPLLHSGLEDTPKTLREEIRLDLDTGGPKAGEIMRNSIKQHRQCLASVPVFAALKRPTKTPTSVALKAASFTKKWRLWMAQWARFDKQSGKTEEYSRTLRY